MKPSLRWVSICAGLLSTQPAYAKPTVDARAKTLFSGIGVIRATADRPDVRDVPLVRTLQACQMKPFRPLERGILGSRYKQRRFFVADTCRDKSYVVISLDARDGVKLVEAEPHVRVPAQYWDHDLDADIEIASPDDVKQTAAAYFLIHELVEIPPSAWIVTEKMGDGPWTGIHYYTATGNDGRMLTLASPDKKKYDVASVQR